jgi:peptidoglycan/xylan/chitin deacetylase (PgdA/CDA1 family)
MDHQARCKVCALSGARLFHFLALRHDARPSTVADVQHAEGCGASHKPGQCVRRGWHSSRTCSTRWVVRLTPARRALGELVVPTIKRRIKAGLGHLLYRSAASRRYWRDRALIVLFHRVDDRYPTDPITVTRKAFESYLDFFASYFQVISLTQLLARLASNADISRNLVITFDDGYLDNWTVAAPKLAARGVPACFFITTGFIGTSKDAPRDAALGVRSEWMTWDHIRALHAAGFELGAHTISHVNLAAADRSMALREIVGSKTRLEAEINTAVHHFAYPFGGLNHFSALGRQLVKDAGFASCLSAYGGTVPQGADPYRLRRLGITPWHLSPYQFGVESLSEAILSNATDEDVRREGESSVRA